MALSTGFRLGPYEILAPIGAGGMGEVYRARDTRLDRTVAIKILPHHLSDDAMRRQRFEREARVVSSLNHPGICTLHDVGIEGGERRPSQASPRSSAYTAYYQVASLFVSEPTQ
jgi:serine/threonine protein kinase